MTGKVFYVPPEVKDGGEDFYSFVCVTPTSFLHHSPVSLFEYSSTLSVPRTPDDTRTDRRLTFPLGSWGVPLPGSSGRYGTLYPFLSSLREESSKGSGITLGVVSFSPLLVLCF